jgi:hypothetical protein
MAQYAQDALFARANKIVQPKRAGYSPGTDPFKNFRASTAVDVEDWRGALVRLGDKWGRMANLTAGSNADAILDADDGLIGNAADLLNYTVIALSLAIESLPEELSQQLLSQLGFPAQ